MEDQNEFRFIKIQYYEQRQKNCTESQLEVDGSQESNQNIMQSIVKKQTLKTKYFDYTIDDLDQRLEQIVDLKQIHSFEFRVSSSEQYYNISDCIASLSNLKYLSINFISSWCLDIVTSANYRLYEEGEDHDNLAFQFKELVNLTHLEINLEDKMFAQVLADFARVIYFFKNLTNLKLKIPPLFTFIDQSTSEQIVKNINGLENLKEYTIILGNINKQDSNFILTLAETIKNQPNLQTLNIEINAQITEEVVNQFVESICQLKSLTSLSFNVQSISSKKSIQALFKPIYKHQSLQIVSINIKEQKSLKYIESVLGIQSLHTLHIFISNQKLFNPQFLINSIQDLHNLKEIQLEFNNNLKLETNQLAELGFYLSQLTQIQRMKLTFNSNNSILPKRMASFLEYFQKLNKLTQLSIYLGKNNYIGKENVEKLAQILSQMQLLESLSISLIENSCVDFKGIQSLYEGILQLKNIQQLYFDIPNTNLMLFVNFLHHFPSMKSKDFQIKNLKLSFEREENQLDNKLIPFGDIQKMQFDSSSYQVEEIEDLDNSFLHKLINLTKLSLCISSNKIIIRDLFKSLQQLENIRTLKIVVSSTILDQEMQQIAKGFTNMKQLRKLNLQIQNDVNFESYQCLTNEISNLTNLEKLQYQVPINAKNKEAAFQFYEKLGSFSKLKEIKFQLDKLDEMKDYSSQFDKSLHLLCKRKQVLIQCEINLNEQTAYNLAEAFKQLKSINNIKFKSTYLSYYELKLFLERGVKHMSSLRYLKMINEVRVDSKRIIRQRSNLIRKIQRLVVLDIV